MDVTVALTRGRELAEDRMTDTCTIRRVTGQETDSDGVVIDTTVDVYAGKCEIQVRGIVGHETTPGEQTIVIRAAEIKLPVLTSGGLAVDDVATIDTCPSDPDMVGARWRLQELFHKTHPTARRIGVRSLPWEAS